MNIQKWYSLTAEEVLEKLNSNSTDGLSTKDAGERQKQVGFNELKQAEKEPWWKRLLEQFQDFMVLVLLAATLISAILGEFVDAITILAIVVVNALLGFLQEYRAEQSLSALKKLAAPVARVIRDGNIQHIPTRELVPGDILLLEPGDKIAADGRLIEMQSLEVEESALTGESMPVRKYVNKTFGEDTSLGDRRNMIFAATSVTRGRAKAVVCATGMHTEVGQIAHMLQSAEKEATPLEKRLENLGRWLVWGCLLICVIVIITGVIKGEPLFLMLMAGISLAVAAIPEGLPAIVTVCLALGMQRMIKRNAIVRKLPAVETLGCVTVICSDKTGTLTQNAMTVRKILVGNKCFDITGNGYDIKGKFISDNQEFDVKTSSVLLHCLKIGCLCNNSVLKRNDVGITGLWRGKKENWSVEGDPTEGALIVAAAKADLWRSEIEKQCVRIGEIPFESERRRMSVIYKNSSGSCEIYVKGAPDTIIELCNRYDNGDTIEPLTKERADYIFENIEQMTSRALRVLAVAYRPLRPFELENEGEHLENDLIFVGLLGMIDPPREEAKQAINLCRQAGIKTVMITGDHKNTAIAIARELSLYNSDIHQALTGRELDALSDKELTRIVNKVTVYARVSPAHKLRIVKALKEIGHIVAMTGDGVNDAPAVKEADIGISMGLTGTDVTKEASAMILADDNFATIVAAVEEGRGIYDNIRKFIRYLLACNTGEVITMFGATLMSLPLPMLPVQILWVNLVTDGLPAMALGVDTKDDNIMQRPPRRPNESVFSRGLKSKIIGRGLQIGLSSLLIFASVLYFTSNLNLARTMCFTTLVMCQMFHVFDCRSEVNTIFENGLFGNRYLLFAVFSSIFMQTLVIYNPFLSEIFDTVSLGLKEWVIILIVSGWTFITNTIKHIYIPRKIKKIFSGASDGI